MSSNILTVALVGLLTGAAGGAAAQWIGQRQAPAAAAEVAQEGVSADLVARLEQAVESLERARGLQAAPAGDDTTTTGLRGLGLDGLDATDGEAPLSPQAEAFLARLEARVATALEAKLQELGASGVELGALEVETEPVTIAEAASQMGLSGDEEQAVRDVYRGTEERLLKLMMDEGEDAEVFKADMREKLSTPEGRGQVMAKMMPKMLTNLGDLMSLAITHESGMKRALGAERASEWDRLNIKDNDFLDMDGFDFD